MRTDGIRLHSTHAPRTQVKISTYLLNEISISARARRRLISIVNKITATVHNTNVFSTAPAHQLPYPPDSTIHPRSPHQIPNTIAAHAKIDQNESWAIYIGASLVSAPILGFPRDLQNKLWAIFCTSFISVGYIGAVCLVACVWCFSFTSCLHGNIISHPLQQLSCYRSRS
jgi:hypothetical protein